MKGVGVVNGGQTTGALGSLDEAEAGSTTGAMVMARFVKYNNTQNKVEATDFRSKDAVQDRLRKEFEAVPDADYRGGRRLACTCLRWSGPEVRPCRPRRIPGKPKGGRYG